ncbi:MAG TPA: VOC family protein [Ktedonobacterales bacterium]|nr:VOC family protein [Ktedonobacterales bacterium]
MSDHPICHVEIPAHDPRANGAFYAEVFGWKVQTDPDNKYHLFEPQRGPGGAFVQVAETTSAPDGGVLIYIYTDDIDATLAKAETLGARTLTPKTESAYGFSAVLADPAGNRIALFMDPSHS